MANSLWNKESLICSLQLFHTCSFVNGCFFLTLNSKISVSFNKFSVKKENGLFTCLSIDYWDIKCFSNSKWQGISSHHDVYDVIIIGWICESYFFTHTPIYHYIHFYENQNRKNKIKCLTNKKRTSRLGITWNNQRKKTWHSSRTYGDKAYHI